MQAHRDHAPFHISIADDKHRVDAQLFRVGNLRLERRRAEIRIHAHHVRAVRPRWFGIIDQRFVVVEPDFCFEKIATRRLDDLFRQASSMLRPAGVIFVPIVDDRTA